MATIFKIRRDTAANWSSNNPTLASGELGLDQTNTYLKVGDGSTAWNSLSQFTQTQETVEDHIGGMVTGNTETFITVTYDDSDGTLDFVVPVLDEDYMSSDSANHLATQQSIKNYVDNTISQEDLDFQADSGGALSIDLNSETLTIAGGTGIATVGSGNTVTASIDSTVTTLTGSQTLTNKTLTAPALTDPTVTGTSSNLNDPVLKITSDSENIGHPQIQLQNSTDDIVSISASRTELSTYDKYALRFSLDPNNTQAQAGVSAGEDYVQFSKGYWNLTGGSNDDGTDTNKMDMHVQGGDHGFALHVKGKNTSGTNANKEMYVHTSGFTVWDQTNGVAGIRFGPDSVTGRLIKDEDNMASNSATHLASQQSIKAYVDAQVDTADALSELADTTITSPADGSLLLYDTGNSVWIDNVMSGDATLADTGALTLATVNSNTGQTGSSTAIPVITVNAKGLVTAVSTASITTSLTVGADSGSDDAVALATDTLNFTGGTGIDTTVSDNDISIAIDSTVATLAGSQTLTNKTLTTPVIASLKPNGSTTLTMPAATDQLVGRATTDTLTNKTLTAATLTSPVLNTGVSGSAVKDEDDMSSNSATHLATQQSIKAYVDTQVTAQDLDIAGDSGTGAIDLDSETLTIAGTANEVTTAMSGNTLTVGLPTNVTIAGNLTVSGTQTTVSSTTVNVADPMLSLATNNGSADAVDIGFYGLYDTSGSQDLYSGLFRDASDSGKWKLYKDSQAEPTTTVNVSATGHATGTLVANLEGNVTGNVVGNLTGNVTGNTSGTAATVTGAAQSAITSVGTLTALQVDNININGNSITTTGGTDLNIGPVAGQQIVLDGTIEIDAGVVTGATSITSTAFVGDLTGDVTGDVTGGLTGNVTGNADTATALANARNIGGVSFDGSANINLPGVNTSGNQDTSGNAATATVLETARTIAGQSFNGSANITIASTDLSNTSAITLLTSTQTLTNKTIDLGDNTVTGTTAEFNSALQDGSFATLAGTETLTNKTITSPSVSGLSLTDSSIVFEGATADSHETTLQVTDPTADRTITLQNKSGTLAFLTDVTGGSSPGNFTTITLDNNIIFEGDTADANETTLAAEDPTADRTVTIPNATGTIVLRDTTDTLTNKTLTAPTIGGTVTAASDFKLSGTPTGLTDPVLDIHSTATGWNMPHIRMSDSNNNVMLWNSEHNTSQDAYKTIVQLDPDNDNSESFNHTAGSFEEGLRYKITSSGNTDFTAIGAADNNVNTFFIATGAGSGTGTAVSEGIAGDYGFYFLKTYGDVATPSLGVRMEENIWGNGLQGALLRVRGNFSNQYKYVPYEINSGGLRVKNNTSAGYLLFAEDESNGSHETKLIGAASQSADTTLTLPSATDTLVGKATTDTLTNKTLTSPVLNTGVSGTAIKDEDNMASDSATHLATQQSIKAYVDSQVTAQDLDFAADSGGSLAIDLDSEALTFTGGTGIDTSGSGNAVTFAIDSTVSTLTGTQTLTNKTLASPTITGTAAGVNLTLSGNLTVNGTTTTVATSNMVVSDNLIELNNGSSTNANDSGIVIERGSTGDNAIIMWDESADKFVVGTTTATGASTGNLTVTTGTLVANLEGATASLTGNITVGGTVDGRDVAADGTKLDGIEASATADQTDAEIRAAVEAASDSNVFTDADHSKLNAIEASADVTDATNVEAAGAVMESGNNASAKIPAGTTAQRDGSPSAGFFRWNTTETQAEIYDGSEWSLVGGGNTTEKALWEHSYTVAENYEITSGNNALTAGPITINSGYSVTVPSGSTWVVV